MDTINISDENAEVENPEQQEEKSDTRTHGEAVAEAVKSVFKIDKINRDLSDVEKSILDKQIEQKEKKKKRDFVDFSRIQIDDVLADRKEGRRIEFETFSPYLADYDLKNGIIWKDNLTNADKIGLALSRLFRDLFPQGRLVSLYDEYNTNLPDSSDARGIPTPDGPQLIVPDEIKKKFEQGIVDLLKEYGSISEDGKEGEDFFMIPESSKQEDAKKLVELLLEKAKETKGLHIRGNLKEGELIFVNENAENPEFRQIPLRTKNNRWLCEALDASSFLKPENREITHIVILPSHFEEQQDKVWEILRALDIAKPETYHNIFYDEKAEPDMIVDAISNEFAKFEETANA